MFVFKDRNWSSTESDRWFFFLASAVRKPFHRKNFKWKKSMGVRGYFLKKQKLYMQNSTKERKQPPVVILQKLIFYNIFIRCLWLRIIRRSNKVFSLWIFLLIFCLTILIMVKEQLYWRKVLCGCFRFRWLWLLIAIMKRCAERCALQLFRTSLKPFWTF